MITAFITGLTLLFIIIGLCQRISLLKTAKFFYDIDFLPVSGGNKQHYAGGIVTLLYIIILSILIGGVIVSLIHLQVHR